MSAISPRGKFCGCTKRPPHRSVCAAPYCSIPRMRESTGLDASRIVTSLAALDFAASTRISATRRVRHVKSSRVRIRCIASLSADTIDVSTSRAKNFAKRACCVGAVISPSVSDASSASARRPASSLIWMAPSTIGTSTVMPRSFMAQSTSHTRRSNADRRGIFLAMLRSNSTSCIQYFNNSSRLASSFGHHSGTPSTMRRGLHHFAKTFAPGAYLPTSSRPMVCADSITFAAKSSFNGKPIAAASAMMHHQRSFGSTIGQSNCRPISTVFQITRSKFAFHAANVVLPSLDASMTRCGKV